MRNSRFFRRIGCLFFLFIVLGLAGLIGIIAVVARWLRLVNFNLDLQSLIPIGLGVLIFAMFLAGLSSAGMRRVAVPLDELLNAADHIGQGDYSVRVRERGTHQVRTLARAFNSMASRLHILDEQRRNMLTDVTHELRSPLTVIQGNIEGMRDGVYPADDAHLRALLEETNILARLVEDLRTLALAESGALQLKKEPTDLALLARETVGAFSAQAEAAGVTLTVDAVTDLPWPTLDPGRIRQVLTNLLANALRYTPAGGTVSIRYYQSEAQAILEVQDNGAGIPPEELPHVFERFYKSADSGGMGLGLAIARKLVEAHSGTISAESTPGTGATLRVTLPLEKM
jgi:signal transduction histidine kinase